MNERKYSKDHQWVRWTGNALRVGISDFAQNQLGEIAFVELPQIGQEHKQGEAVCSIDSLKSTSELYAPVSGTIVDVNRSLEDESCTIINSDPLGEGWIFALEPTYLEEWDQLMTEQEYQRYITQSPA